MVSRFENKLQVAFVELMDENGLKMAATQKFAAPFEVSACYLSLVLSYQKCFKVPLSLKAFRH